MAAMTVRSTATTATLRLALLASALGCRPTTASTAANPVRAQVAKTTTASSEAMASDTAAPAGHAAAMRAPVTASLAAVDSGLPAGAIVILLPHDDGGTALFRDERLALRRVIASSLRARGLEVASLDELEALERAAATGVLLPEGQRQCAVGLREQDMVARWFRHTPLARVELECIDGCRLRVHLERAGDIAFLESPVVTRPGDPQAWHAAALALAPVEDPMRLGLIGMGTSAQGPIFFTTPTRLGPWRGEPPDERIAALERPAAACDHPEPFASIFWELRVAVSKDGAVARCESESGSPLARAREAECLCTVVQEARFEPGRAGRRLRFTAHDFASASLQPSISIATGRFEIGPGSDEEALAPWLDQITAHEIVDRCLLEHRPADEIAADVLLHLHEDGRVQDVEINGRFDRPETVQLAACLVRELQKVPLACAPPGVTTLPLRFVYAHNRANP